MLAGNGTLLQMLAKVESSSKVAPSLHTYPCASTQAFRKLLPSEKRSSMQSKGSNNYRHRGNGDEAPTSPALCHQRWGLCSCLSQRLLTQHWALGKSHGLLLLIPTGSCFVSLSGLWNQCGALLETKGFYNLYYSKTKDFLTRRDYSELAASGYTFVARPIFQIVSSHCTPCTPLIYADSSLKLSFVKYRFLSPCLLCLVTTTIDNLQEMVQYTQYIYLEDTTLPDALLRLQVHRFTLTLAKIKSQSSYLDHSWQRN